MSRKADKTSYVFGYDKDSDVYELLFTATNMTRACELTEILIRSGQLIRRSGNNEPFDWFVVSRSNDPYDLHKIFTHDHPDGYQPA